MKRGQFLLLVVVCCLVLLLANGAWACPNCKEAIAAQPGGDGSHTREGFFWSILFMMGMPFLLLGTGITMFVRAAKKGLLPEF